MFSNPGVHFFPISSVSPKGYRKNVWYSFLYLQDVFAKVFVIFTFLVFGSKNLKWGKWGIT